ncbi:transforming acidic coiled-coil-containing protein 2-like isoform X2 [Falco rusticolus]|uniref:transforming acidic coiled-coil-containing protein 2-like isoform X2 n=1 Tax=Falco rusticolus TaxID=120794 RepID=UPI0018866221|nr:transforming acidic coiled-coil-containing protein 2-like isoform X2 [Falco rusticolus]
MGGDAGRRRPMGLRAGPGGDGAGETMHRKEHRGLSTGGSTGAASPQVTPESCPAEPDVRPDVQRPRKRCRTPAGGHLPDGAAPCSDPAVGGPKKHCLGLRTALDPDVEKKTAVLKGEPPNDLPDPQKGGDPDAKHLEGPDPALESDRAVKATPKTALFHPNRRWATLEACSRPDVEERGPNPDVGGPQKGCWVLGDSDTDVELENSTSAVEGPRNGHRALVSESDPDVEGGGADPDVGCPPSHRTGRQVIVSDSDTDVELNGAEPDVGHPKPHRPTQNEATPPLPEAKAPNAAVGGSQAGGWVLVVDSDTDVEEELSNPDVGCLEGPGAAPREPDVKAGTASRCAGEARGALLLESDTDVEEELSNPDVGCLEGPGAAPREPDVKEPDVKAGTASRRAGEARGALLLESDTDVEEELSDPDVGAPPPPSSGRQATSGGREPGPTPPRTPR